MAAIRVHTPALYRGLPITVIGYGDVTLIAVAGYATPHERALGVITTEHDGSRTLYRVAGHHEAVATLDEAARAVEQRCAKPRTAPASLSLDLVPRDAQSLVRQLEHRLAEVPMLAERLESRRADAAAEANRTERALTRPFKHAEALELTKSPLYADRRDDAEPPASRRRERTRSHGAAGRSRPASTRAYRRRRRCADHHRHPRATPICRAEKSRAHAWRAAAA